MGTSFVYRFKGSEPWTFERSLKLAHLGLNGKGKMEMIGISS